MHQLKDIQADLVQLLHLPELYVPTGKSTLAFNSQTLLHNRNEGQLSVLNEQQIQRFQRLKSRRLGIYFELLWLCLIENSSRYTNILNNQQIIDNKKTLGEFDFILQDHKQDQSIHLEVAIKFYLNTSHLFDNLSSTLQARSQQERFWRGPNSADSLAKKYNHLINKQLKLAQHKAAETLLIEKNIQLSDSKFSIKGYLFNHWLHQHHVPYHYSEPHIPNVWLYDDEIESYLEFVKKNTELDDCKLFFITKAAWIHQTHQQVEAITADDIERYLIGKDSPQMFGFGDSKKVTGTVLIKETLRFFVAPKCWPSQPALKELSES